MSEEMHALVERTVNDLCVRFEQGGYNPTPIVDLGVLVAQADGVVDEKERTTLSEVFESLLEERLSPEVVDHLITASIEVIDTAGAPARVRLIAEILKDCDAVEQGLLVALIVAFASDGLSQTERGVIEQIARAAGLPPSRLDKLIERVHDHVPEGVSVRDSLPSSRRIATKT